MKNALKKSLHVVLGAALVTSMAACTTSDEETRAATVQELTDRGFEDVTFVEDLKDGFLINGPHDALYTVKVGTCRVEIIRSNTDARFDYRSLDMRDESVRSLVELADANLQEVVNADFLRDNAEELGIPFCVSAGM